MKKHIISVLVENHFGVLGRVANLFSSRAYNIQSLTVGETEDPNTSRMTIVVFGDKDILEQIQKQLNKLIDVIKVRDITGMNLVDREALLIKINATSTNRAEIIQAIDIFKGNVVGIKKDSITTEIFGDSDKIEAFIEFIKPFGVKEMVRSGRVAIVR
jgi:acetolactate synthase I/III small subunit